MAAYTTPKHAFDTQIVPDMGDASKLDFSNFDDIFSVEGQSFVDPSGHSPGEPSPLPFPYSGPMSVTAHGVAVPISAPSPDSAMNQYATTASFAHPQHPGIWFDQNGWMDSNDGHKGGMVNFDAKGDQNAYSGPHVDYSFLAGESAGLLGVGESGNISSCSPSISGSQSCFSDLLYSSPSSSSSLHNFNAADQSVESTASLAARRHTPSFEGRSSRTLSASSHQQMSGKTSDEPIFKAPTVPASATAQGRRRRSSPRAPQSFNEAADKPSMISVQDPSFIHQHQQHQQHVPPGHTPPFHIGPLPSQTSHPISPATSQNSSQTWNAQSRNSQSGSPYYGQTAAWHPHPSHSSSRRQSFHSANSPRHASVEFDDEGRERTQCPYPDCGKAFKDLKAHILTHQNERPEKCPITSCEFHKRGFARKYDRNRHLVTTHYKATIVCGFCPGSGSSAEKSFNRTDVFKRHLVAVHGVEQTPSNSKKRTPRNSARQSPSLPDDVTGKCSTCGNLFASPQELFEHFDDCVLRVVTQTDPGEEANEKNLRSVIDDGDVKSTMERHSLPNDTGSASTPSANDDAEDNSDSLEETIVSARAARSGKGSLAAPKSHTTGSTLHTVAEGHVMKSTNRPNPAGKGSAGMTYSKGGVSLSAGKGRKKRKHYPQSWGCSIDKMKLKKRVLCVFDGQRRLWKDDMMLGDDFEVRMKLPNGGEGSYVTDLDVETLKRAEAFHAATEEERGPWIPSNYSSGDWTLMQQQMTA